MPYKEREIIKKYFTIGEVAKNLKLSTSQIRFWETEFKELNPKKNSKGSRKFTEKDIVILKEIQSLLKNKKYTIDGAKKIIKKKINHRNIGNDETIKKLYSLKEKLIFLKKKI
tara:strand:+ start:1166 stop:1504 length:339 start_codon:yes stop_codon:yes gene_type:complete